MERGGRMVGSGWKCVHGENEGENDGRFPFSPGTEGNPSTLYEKYRRVLMKTLNPFSNIRSQTRQLWWRIWKVRMSKFTLDSQTRNRKRFAAVPGLSFEPSVSLSDLSLIKPKIHRYLIMHLGGVRYCSRENSVLPKNTTQWFREGLNPELYSLAATLTIYNGHPFELGTALNFIAVLFCQMTLQNSRILRNVINKVRRLPFSNCWHL